MGVPRAPRVGGPRVGQQQPRPMNQPGPQPMTMMARPGMPPVPMVGAQVRPQQSFKYTPSVRNPPSQVMPQQSFKYTPSVRESTQPGDAWPDGGSRWSPTTTAGCARPRTGAANSQYAGCSTTAGTETDAGRETLPSDPENVPGFGWKDHWNAARDRQCRVGS